MISVTTLTNRTRSAQRPPLCAPEVNALRLAQALHLPAPALREKQPVKKRVSQSAPENSPAATVQQSQKAVQPVKSIQPASQQNTSPARTATASQALVYPSQPEQQANPPGPSVQTRSSASQQNRRSRGAQLPPSTFLHSQRNSHQPASQLPFYKPLPFRQQPEKTFPKTKGPLPAAVPPAVVPPARKMPLQEPLLEEPAVPQADRKQPDQADPPPPAVPETQAMPVNPGSQLAASSKNASERAEVTLPQLFERHPDLPPQATILGISDDGLPVVFDLADPSPGAVLVIGDERDEQLALLRTAVASLTARNTPRSVQILVISHQPQSWKSWIAERGLGRYLLDVLGGDDVAVREWVLRLADWTEQRRLGQRTGPAVLLVMDTLSFLSRLTYDVRLNFEWLVKEGPPAQIWPVAAVSTDLARSLGTRLVGVFQTRLLGFSRDPEAYLALASVPQEDIHSFRKTGQFSVQAGINWLRFRALHGL